MSVPVEVYQNYLGALVVNDCPVCDQSHFLTEGKMSFEPSDEGGTYICHDEEVEVVNTGGS